MADLYNDFPSWGESGEYPQNGFFYDGGDQVNEKHLDALWNGVQTHIDSLNTAIRDRVRDFEGNVVIDQGLVASLGSGVREVDVASSNGAYVDGQFTGPISTDTVTLSSNGGASTRTDVLWVDTGGTIGVTEGSTTASTGRLKIAEADVATDDTISALRNYARDVTAHVASENSPNGEPGDIWHDLTSNRVKIRQSGAYRKLLTEQDSATVTAGDGLKNGGTFNLDGGSVTLDIEPTDFAGAGLQDDGTDNLELINDSVTVTAGDGLKSGGTVSLGGSVTLDIEPTDFAGDGVKDDGADNIAVEPNDFAGAGLQDDGTDNLELINDSVTVTAGDGLKNGGLVSLGGSVTLDIEPADFAGDGLIDGGADDLDVSVSDFAGTHLSDDGSNNLTVDDDFVLNTGDAMSGTLTLNATQALDMSSGSYASFPSVTSAPAGATAGDFWYRSDLD